MCELVRARQGVVEDGVGARKELGRQADGDGLHLAQDRRSQGVEERRPGATPLAKGMHSCGVVAKDNHCATSER